MQQLKAQMPSGKATHERTQRASRMKQQILICTENKPSCFPLKKKKYHI